MIGLPFETDDDIEGIISLVEKINLATLRKMRINISISPFVPKVMTPFQWVSMDEECIVLKKALKIKQAFSRYKNIKVSYHTIELSFLEAVLSRGDSNTSYVIERAYMKGAKFDAWSEYFDYHLWQEAAEEVGYNWYKPIHGFDLSENLPWDNINIGITKEFLLKEYIKATKGILTNDCRKKECSQCGICNKGRKHMFAKWENILPMIKHNRSHEYQSEISKKCLYRIYFSKLNELKYLSHLDFLRLIHRLLMHSRLPFMFSQGNNPHPKTSFCPPLSSGIEGENEFFEIWCFNFVEPDDLIKQLSKIKILDLHFFKAIVNYKDMVYDDNYVSINLYDIETIELDLTLDNNYYIPLSKKSQCDDNRVVTYLSDTNENSQQLDISTLKKVLDLFLQSNDTIYKKTRKGTEVEIDLKEIILITSFHDNKLYITKRIKGASIYDIIHKVFGIERKNAACFRLLRKTILSSKDFFNNKEQ